MKRLIPGLFVVTLWFSFTTLGLAAETGPASSSGEKVFELITDVAMYTIGTTFVVRWLLEFIDVKLKKRGTIILAVIVCAIFVTVGIFFPQWPLPTFFK